MHNHSPGLSPALGDETLGNRRNTSTGTLKGCDKTAVLLRIIAWPLTSQSLKSFDLGNMPPPPATIGSIYIHTLLVSYLYSGETEDHVEHSGRASY